MPRILFNFDAQSRNEVVHASGQWRILISPGAFGKIQRDISGTSGLTAGNPRILQLALKAMF